MKKLIYVVEDDSSLRAVYMYSLEYEFDCVCFGDSSSFFSALISKIPDLIILDIMLPGTDGFSILSRVKTGKTAHVPVIMVSARGDEVSKVKGLNMGADDYISKPFGVLELIARIKANLRKYAPPERIIFKDIEIDMGKHKVFINGSPVQMTLKEYNLLALLAKNAENVQEREKIFAKVWGDDFVGETRTLDIHIRELRKKLEQAQSETEIKTIRGVGYILI